MSNKVIKIIKAQIPIAMSDSAVTVVTEAMGKFTIEKVGTASLIYYTTRFLELHSLREQDMATFIKKKCDEQFGGTWHCVVGRNFGCSITHDTKFVLFFQVDLIHVLLFKSLD